MATERDAYELDTSAAAASLARLRAEIEKTEANALAFSESSKVAAASGEVLAGAAERATMRWAVAGAAIVAAGHQLLSWSKEAVNLYAEQEQADRRLALAAGVLTNHFLEQAEAIEEATGADAVMVEKMQSMLLVFGQAPAEVDRTVKALLDYAARTGNDAVGATEMMISSASTGRVAFKDLGLEYDNTAGAMEQVTEMTEALTDRLGGSAADEAKGLTGATRRAGQAWENFLKITGGRFASFEQHVGVVTGLTNAVNAFNKASALPTETESLVALQEKLATEYQILEAAIARRDALKKREAAGELQGYSFEKEALRDLNANYEANVQRLGDLGVAIANIQGRRKELSDETLMAAAPNSTMKFDEVDVISRDLVAAREEQAEAISDANDKAFEEGERIGAALIKQQQNVEEALFQVALDGLKKIRKEEEKEKEDELKLFEAQGKAAAAADEKRREQEAAAQRAYHLREFNEARAQAERLRDLKQDYERELVNFANSSAESLLSAQVGYLWQNVTAHTQAAAQLRELELERATAGMSELEALETRASLEQQLQDEQVAGFWKVTAETLSSIGQQALMKGLLSGADALAFLAMGNVPAAVLAGEAALAYGAVAIGAGGAAAGISAARGVSADEQAQIDSASKVSTPSTSSAGQSTSKGGAAGGGGGPQLVQNVTYFGISSTSEMHQAAELERLRRKFVAQKTGAGGP